MIWRSEPEEAAMLDAKLVNWSNLPVGEICTIFPDAERLGDMDVEFFSKKMGIYRFSDAAGNDAFGLVRGDTARSHGSQILSRNKINELRMAGADIG